MEEKMTPHEARAAELFLSGAVCAQAVFCAFCDLHGIDFETASCGGNSGFSCIIVSTSSTTTIASSTTIPIANTKANNEIVFAETPKILIPTNAPIKETGIASVGIIVALKVPKKKYVTNTINKKASKIVWKISLKESSTNSALLKTVLN